MKYQIIAQRTKKTMGYVDPEITLEEAVECEIETDDVRVPLRIAVALSRETDAPHYAIPADEEPEEESEDEDEQ